MNEQIYLNISNLAKNYRSKKVLMDINISLNGEKVVSIVGENGSGKSTLIKILLKLAKQNSGNFDCGECKINGILETPNFYLRFSGKENIRMITGNTSLDDERLNYLADIFRLKDDLDLPVKKYSLGMRQKLAIIYVLYSNADILLFDEPTNALDQMALSSFRQILIEEKQKGKLIIVASHNLEYVDKISDEIYELKDGCVNPLSSTFTSSNAKGHIFEFEDIAKAIDIAKNHGCSYEIYKDKFLKITDWYISMEELFSVFISCGIKAYKKIDDQNQSIEIEEFINEE